MSDQHEFRLEPTEGKRTGGPPGERFVVGLALFVLFTGLLIALGKLVGQPAAVSSPGSPGPSPTASSTPAWPPLPPSHLLREITLQPAAAPTPAPSQPNLFSGGIRANADLVIRANPEADAIQLGVLVQGALAYAEESPDAPPAKPGWLHILSPDQGWVATTDGGAQMVERLAPAPVPASGDIWAVLAGGDRFLAIGWPAGTSAQQLQPLIAASAHGDTWQVAALQASPGNGVVSWGPAGWLALAPIGDNPSGSAAWVWQSNDGVSWTVLGTSDSLGQYPSQMVSSDAGYLLAATTGRGADTTLWFSEDGLSWRETADTGMSSGDWVRLAGGPKGFYAWDVPRQQPSSSKPGAVYSADARTWSPVTGGPEGPSAQIVAVGAQWVGTDVDPAVGVRRVWLGEVNGDRLTWHRESDQGAFGSGAVTTMVSDGRRAVAFGWDRPVERPMSWIREGTAWRRSPLPPTFGGVPRIAAGGRGGVVVVGYRPTLRGPNPVFWHQAAGGSWTPESDPLLTLVADPSSNECAPAPATAADFMALDHALAVACLGDTPLTFRAWSLECSGCFGGGGSGTPAWLATPDTNQLALSPIERFDGWSTTVVLAPLLKQDRAWKNTWLEVTGHFDDPAAKTCELTPTRDEEAYYTGRQSVIDGCRQQFVVTSVTPVDGP